LKGGTLVLDANPQIDQFKQQLRDALQRHSRNARKIKIAKHGHVYTCGDPGETIYFVESGQVKLLMLSPQGKECLLAIYTAGDIFGEACLSGLGARVETAIAMEDTLIKQISCPQFLAQLSRDGLFGGFVQYLAVRIAEQQELIANLVTVDSEQRLGKTLLYVARKVGRKEPCDVCKNIGDICIEHNISHEELSKMVGTTRPRISVFMQRFRNLGLIETSTEHFLIINENKLSAYLSQIA
jgi:CRP/FNR family transcriptional regulator, cyclic AMP receptor protein